MTHEVGNLEKERCYQPRALSLLALGDQDVCGNDRCSLVIQKQNTDWLGTLPIREGLSSTHYESRSGVSLFH